MSENRISNLFKLYWEIIDIAWRLRDCIRKPVLQRKW